MTTRIDLGTHVPDLSAISEPLMRRVSEEVTAQAAEQHKATGRKEDAIKKPVHLEDRDYSRFSD